GAVRGRLRLVARVRRAVRRPAPAGYGARAPRPRGDRAAVAAPGHGVTSPTPATAVDAPAVIALIARIWEEYAFIWDPPTEVPDLFRFDEHYAPPHGAFWIVRDDAGRVVGSIGVERLSAATAEIHRLYLDAHLRGRGIG